MTTLKYGRRPPKNAPALAFSDILRTTEPTYPPTVDYLAPLSDWQMLGNDEAGDCVAVTWANERRLVTATLAEENYPSQGDVWKVYQTQNPGFKPGNGVHGYGSDDDQGMDIQTLLEYLVSDGGPDGVKAVAFAKVNISNADEVKAAIAIFGSLWTGITVLDVNQTEFSEGKPWDYDSTSPVDGGHSVVSGGYKGQAADDVQFITWAQETGFTDSFWTHETEEAWVVIWPEHFGTKEFEAGVNQANLASAYQALTGKVLPLPEPTPPAPPAPTPTPPIPPTPPVPTPGPNPDPDPADEALAEAIEASGFLEHKHTLPDNKEAAAAVKAWEEAKGLETESSDESEEPAAE